MSFSLTQHKSSIHSYSRIHVRPLNAANLSTSYYALRYILTAWESFRTSRGPLASWNLESVSLLIMQSTYKYTLGFGLGLSAVVDILISGIMTYYFRKRHAGFKSYVLTCLHRFIALILFYRTVNVVHLLMGYTINSGLITSCVHNNFKGSQNRHLTCYLGSCLLLQWYLYFSFVEINRQNNSPNIWS